MQKLWASIRKEFLLLINDKVGLLLMYLMPIFLVFIITLVQDSTFRLVNENTLEVIVVNRDKGAQGDSLIQLLHKTGAFKIEEVGDFSEKQAEKKLLGGDQLMAVVIPKDFTKSVKVKAKNVSIGMLKEFQILEDTARISMSNAPPLKIIYDPVLQESFRMSIVNSFYAQLNVLENKLMVEQLYEEMGFDGVPKSMEDQFAENQLHFEQTPAGVSSGGMVPNSTQHNVPAWSIFAMFFMVISLGGNIVKERRNGSFIRLQTIPASFFLVLTSKVFVYLIVALTQLTIIFALGKFVFPFLGLPPLVLPDNFLGLVLISVLSALAAIHFAMLVGTYAKTQEQANGFGAVTVIIFAAIGGIWVPSFIMPSHLQTLGNISPLHWCLDGFYTLFLRGGDWYLLSSTIIFLIIFVLVCQILIYVKLKIQNYL